MLRSRVAIGLVAGVVAAVLALVPAALADGHSGHGEGHTVRGVVTAFSLPAATASTVSGSVYDGSLTLTEGNGNVVTLEVTPTTTIDMSAGALASLLAGNQNGQALAVVVGGSSGSEVALVVLSAPNEAGDQGLGHETSVSGVVQSVASGSFVLQRENGNTVTVDVSATTEVKTGDQTLPAADIVSGARVEASGALNADGTLTATVVRIANEHSDKAMGKINGTVASAPGGSPASFTLTTSSGTTVTVNLATNVVVRVGDHTGTVQDIVSGASVQLLGTTNADGSFNAVLVKVSNDHAASGNGPSDN